MATFEDVAWFIRWHIDYTPICVETGTVYTFLKDQLWHNTTNNIVKTICEPLNGRLYSIDLLDRTSVINELFSLQGLDTSRVIHLVGDSIEQIQKLSVDTIDLLCLDSGEDPDLLVEEFRAARPKLAKNHYVLVDDIHNPNSVKHKKIVPMLKDLGYDWIEVATPTGLFLSARGYPVVGL